MCEGQSRVHTHGTKRSDRSGGGSGQAACPRDGPRTWRYPPPPLSQTRSPPALTVLASPVDCAHSPLHPALHLYMYLINLLCSQRMASEWLPSAVCGPLSMRPSLTTQASSRVCRIECGSFPHSPSESCTSSREVPVECRSGIMISFPTFNRSSLFFVFCLWL
jgi:hypothetical protein